MSRNAIILTPIGHVRGGRAEPTDDAWDAVAATIELDPAQFKPDATASLGDFSHIEVVFHFDQVPDEEINSGARHPRGRKDWPLVGIFAQRGKGRPNRIGITICKLERADGLTLSVRGLDAIDGTPILDIKPVMKGFLPRGPTLAANIGGQRLSINDFVQRFNLSQEARDAIASELRTPGLAQENFTFDTNEFNSLIAFKSVELSNGGTLTAPFADFDDVFEQEVAPDGDEVTFRTHGRIINENLKPKA